MKTELISRNIVIFAAVDFFIVTSSRRFAVTMNQAASKPVTKCQIAELTF